ncbi:MAG: phage holin family protein [Bacilli bacterium]|nr:phage holin family protein [Bacilli bacterium]
MKINKYLDWFIHMVGYALVLITISVIFQKTIYIDNRIFGLWGLIAVIIVFILNRTIKPILVWMTLPLTALTLGLFYPLINILILKITDFILGNHFEIKGTIMLFFVSITISIMNAIMDNIIIDNLLKGRKK